MAAGKTSVGRELGVQLQAQFVDLDAAIEARHSTTIDQIFSEQGEEAFRQLESLELQRAVELDTVVVALGGGAVLSPGNRHLIAEGGTLVWLDTRRSTILDRLEQEGIG